jgi:uncharacterized protein YjbI with pentapeptide repeats
MNENSRIGLDTETPVNPYSLLESVNRSSASARWVWLIFLVLMGYLLITVAGVGHKDLLLNSDMALPMLQVKIALMRFFLFAPILLVLIHMGVIGQVVLLARKALEFSAAVRMLEVSDRRTHPLRLELDNLFLVQAIAGPERSLIVGVLLHAMSWLTLVMLPVLLLLYIQTAFLPYHDAAITSLDRLALLADVALLVLIGAFLWRLETSFLQAFWRAGRHHPVGLLLAGLLLVSLAAISLVVATVPDSADPVGTGVDEANRSARASLSVEQAFAALGGGAFAGLFARNLDVTDTDLIGERGAGQSPRSINLRGRDLRHARLDRSNLRQADLTGANLDGASLAGADLRGTYMECGDIDARQVTENRAAARCASARGANFGKARLAEAKMTGVDLSGARLEGAELEGADLAQARLSGANFAGARLDRADLSGSRALGASFLLASLNGADLGGAALELADFTSAALEGANLSVAGLAGARLRNARLEGASLQRARLMGTDVAGAKLQASDWTNALVWRAVPPASEDTTLADMTQLVLRPPAQDELAGLGPLAEATSGALKPRLLDAVARLRNGAENTAWASSAEQQLWQGLIRSSEATADTYKGRLTDYLARLMCRARFADGAVASGIARRALAPGFKGDLAAIYDRLKGTDCPAGRGIGQTLMRDLAAIGDAARP